MRIYELAKDIGMDSKILLKKLQSMKIDVKNHMSSIDTETAEIVKHELQDLDKKEIEQNVIEVDFPITLKDFAVKLGKKPSDILTILFKKGKMFTINSNLDEKTATELAYDYRVNLKKQATVEEQIFQAKPKDLEARPPVVTLMGHIDHGKTSILDYIRKSKVADKEMGGITQHMGAYHVELPHGNITFLDTPGHETFTAMRSRGADATDIIVIVIAADEGIKPQTVEAIDHAKASKASIIVAINKMDRPNADIEMVKQQLSKHELVPEDWGGKTITVPVSAKTGDGIDSLLEMLLLQAEVMELKASYKASAIGVVVESKISKGRGSVSTILIQQGVLKVSDVCACGTFFGRVRAMHDDRGKNIKQASPSSPVEVVGLNGVPDPGEKIFVVPNEKEARKIVEAKIDEEKKNKQITPTHLTFEDLHKKIVEGNLKQLKIILKADVGGTLEATADALAKFSTDEVELKFIHKGVGSINYSDVLLAEVSDAIIVGFKVETESQAKEGAKSKGIEIRVYHIVYELIDDVKLALEGMLTPHVRRTFVGRARVQKVFKLSKMGVVAGCIVEKGKMVKQTVCQVTRGNEVIHEGKITSLKRFKDEAKEVVEGLECGVSVGYDKIKEGDFIDIYNEEKILRRI